MRQTYSYTHKVVLTVGIVVLYLAAVALLVSSIKVLLLIFAGILFAVPLSWLLDQSQKRFRGARAGHLTAILFALIALVFAFIALIVPALSTQITELIRNLPTTLERVRDVAQRHEFSQPIAIALEDPQEWLNSLTMPAQEILRRVPGVFSTTVSIIAIPLIVMVIGAYIAAEPKLYMGGFTRLLPQHRRPRMSEVFARLGHTLRWWLLGQSIAMTVLGVVTGIFLWILNIPLALLLAVITAITNFIPNIGPFIAAIPTILMALTVGPWHAVGVAVFFVVLQNVEGTILTPMIQRRMIALPPVLIITTQILLSSLIGIAGVILAMPLIACLIVIVRMLYVEDVLERESERGDAAAPVPGEP